MPKPNRNTGGVSMPRQMGPQMPRRMGAGMRSMDHLGSPSQNPQRFTSNVQGALDSLLGQMGTPGQNVGGGPRAYLPDSGPGGGAGGAGGGPRRRRRRYIDQQQDPTLGPYFGPESLNTYAPAIDPKGFQEPDYLKKGLKGSKVTGGGFGGMGGMFGMMGAGGNPFASGMGGMGMMPGGGMDFLSMIFPMLLQQLGGSMGGMGTRMGR